MAQIRATMRIRNLLLACIGIVGLIAVVGAGSRAVDAVLDIHKLELAMDAAKGLKLSMILSERISAERSKISTLLGVAPLGQSSALSAVERARLGVEDGLRDLEAHSHLSEVAQPLAQAMAALRSAHDTAVRLRDGVGSDEVVRADRDFVLAAARTQEVLSRLVEEHERTFRRFSPSYGQLAGMATLSQALREITGFRSALLSPHLAQHQLSRSELRELDELSGQVRSAWRRIQVTVMQVAHPSVQLLQTFQAMGSTIMGEGDKRYRALITELGEGRTPEMTIAQYRAWTSPMLSNALLLRNIVFVELDRLLSEERRRTTWQVVYGSLGAALAVAVVVGAAWLVMRRVASPLRRLTHTVSLLADGNLDVEMEGCDGLDELGRLAHAVLVLRDRAREAKNLRTAVETEQATKLAAAVLLTTAARTFEDASASEMVLVEHGEATLRLAVESLDLASQRTADQTHGAALQVAATASQVEILAEAVATVEATVEDVSLRMASAAAAVAGAESGAGTALAHIVELAEVASRISAIVYVINDIASRTKLLALNASMEASRAGVEGRGFAVVAAEVKNLAVQTAQATHDVGLHIEAIQRATHQAGNIIRALSSQVAAVAQAAGTVVAAVRQQRVATDDIALAARVASEGAAAAAAQVEQAAKRTQDARALALTLPSLADDIGKATGSLRTEIETFIGTVRQAA